MPHSVCDSSGFCAPRRLTSEPSLPADTWRHCRVIPVYAVDNVRRSVSDSSPCRNDLDRYCYPLPQCVRVRLGLVARLIAPVNDRPQTTVAGQDGGSYRLPAVFSCRRGPGRRTTVMRKCIHVIRLHGGRGIAFTTNAFTPTHGNRINIWNLQRSSQVGSDGHAPPVGNRK